MLCICYIKMIIFNCIKQAHHSSSGYRRWVLLRYGATVSGNAGLQNFWFKQAHKGMSFDTKKEHWSKCKLCDWFNLHNFYFQALVDISPFPFDEVGELREKYTYNIAPWSQGIAVAKKGLRILYR